MNSTIDLCKIPAGKSPDGKYNFIDPPSLGPAVIAVGTTLLVLSTAFTTGRLFMNRNKLHSADCKTGTWENYLEGNKDKDLLACRHHILRVLSQHCLYWCHYRR